MAELRFVVDPQLTATLTGELVDCWADVVNTGGAVGFVPPVAPGDIAETAAATFAACDVARGGPDHLLVGFDAEDRVACWLVLADGRSWLRAHWRWVLRVMVHPKHQGAGYGTRLMLAADDAARDLSVEALHLTVRGGTGTEGFYSRLGYAEVGRIPGAIRLAPGDDRDEIYMVKHL